MADRYIIISRHNSMLYLSNCPVIILAGALLKDSYTDSMMVQLKFENIGLKTLSSVAISLSLFDGSDNSISDDVQYTYSDLNVGRDTVFGKNTAIVLPDADIHSYKIRINKVCFADGSSCSFGDDYLLPLLAPEKLESALGSAELANQFRISCGHDCIYYPADRDGLWFCTCGAVNLAEESKCHKCRRVYSALKSINIQALRSEANKRTASKKEYDIDEKEPSAQKRSLSKKLIFILLPVILVIALTLATVPGYLIRKSNYSKGQTLLSQGKYDEATAIFEKLDSYLDCKQLSEQEVPYQKALYVYKCAESENTDALVMLSIKRSEFVENETVSTVLYGKAAEMFEALGEYKDSKFLAGSARNAIAEYQESLLAEEYSTAHALLDGKNYCMARDAFLKLGGYMDSADMVQECINRKLSALASLCEKYSIDGIQCRISLETGVKSTFYIPKDVFIKLGSSISADIRDACGEDGAEILYEEAPSDDFLPYTDALISLGYSDISSEALSPETESEQQKAADEVQVFYDLCADGDLITALQWVSGYGGNQLDPAVWTNLINLYLPFCGSWALDEGDPSLIPAAIGIQAQCRKFISTVKLTSDSSAQLEVYIEGNRDYAIVLQPEIKSDGTVSFSASPDGMNIYYAVINKAGGFNCSKYNIYAAKQLTNSCSYKKTA